MKKRIGILILFLLTALTAAGCTMQTVEQMYCVPRRSQSFDHVQSAMDMAMVGLEFAAPVSGENQQTVQLADLDGDGEDEYILFARNPSQIPLNILIFDTDEEGKCYLQEVLELQGAAFEKVEYVDLDGTPGLEMIVGRQLSNQLQGNLAVYSFSSGRAHKLMASQYVHFLTSDLDGNNDSELLVIQSGAAGQPGEERAVAISYHFGDDGMERSMEVKLSAPGTSVERILEGQLESGAPAVFVSSAVASDAIATDVLCVQQGKLLSLLSQDSSVMALRNYYVYPSDIDGDGATEIPSLIPMRAVNPYGIPDSQFLISWYSVDQQGGTHDKLYTFHEYGGGWYLELDPAWAERISVDRSGNTYTFYFWQEEQINPDPLFTLYVFTGSDRDQLAGSEGRFPLLRMEGVAYGAELYDTAVRCHVTEEYLKNCFHLIRQDWKTGET